MKINRFNWLRTITAAPPLNEPTTGGMTCTCGNNIALARWNLGYTYCLMCADAKTPLIQAAFVDDEDGNRHAVPTKIVRRVYENEAAKLPYKKSL